MSAGSPMSTSGPMSGRHTSDLAPAVNVWFRANARALPWRESGFSPWGILVSEFMLQQTPVARVIAPLQLWLERWPTPQSLAASPSGEAVRAWGRLGYPRRALRLHACAVQITERFGGAVPDDVEQLLTLPGVGDYTARAVAVFAYGHRHPVVDTNVRRVLARALDGTAEPAPPSTTRDLAAMEAVLPQGDVEARVTNAAIMELGALLCTARTPRCSECPIANLCTWRAAGFPKHVGPRRKVQARYAGSDRQVRGVIMAELRNSDTPLAHDEITALWADANQLARALASLRTDELVTGDAIAGYQLPE